MEKYSLDTAREIAHKMSEKLEKGEVGDYSEAEQKINYETLEAILTPEVVDKIMQKVVDINETGTAYHSLHTDRIGRLIKDSEEEKLASLLQSGIVGVSKKGEGTEYEKEIKLAKESYLGFIKKKERPNVYFNIVGRITAVIDDPEVRMEDNFIMFSKTLDATVIVFDLSFFKEVPNDHGDELPSRTYSNNSESKFSKDHIRTDSDSKGEINKSSMPDYGFRLSGRVKPRFFKGIVIHVGEDRFKNKEKYQSRLVKSLQEVVNQMIEVDKEKPEYFLPIYDVDGNLLWPKEIPYEEVKRIVEKTV